MSDFKTFDAAVRAFEHQFNCRLCLHDYTGRFHECSLPRFHLNPYCTKLKKKNPGTDRICIAFDTTSIQKHHGNSSEPFYKYCPLGYLEAVFPVMSGGKVCAALFAGPFSGAPPLVANAFHENIRENDLPSKPPPLSPESRRDLLALGALLAQHLAECVARPYPTGSSRRERIEQFIARNYSRPIGLDDLAEFIGLSPARTSEQVKKLFGEGFAVLLNHRRLQMAQRLLEHSAFNIETVAERCGFHDSAYFHRVFRRLCGETPTAYRRRTANPNA